MSYVYVAQKNYGYGEIIVISICSTVALAKQACSNHDIGLGDMNPEWLLEHDGYWSNREYEVIQYELDLLPTPFTPPSPR